MCGILSNRQRNLLILPLEQSFVPASCAGQHDLMDSFRNAMAVPTGPPFPSLARHQFSLHVGRQLASSSLAARLEMDD